MSDQAAPLLIRLPQLDQIQARLDAVLEGWNRQEWYTLEQAWRRKYAAVIKEGSISLQTFKNTRAYQPQGGHEDAWISNRKVWREATIEEWLTVDDDALADYLGKHRSAAPIPDRIKKAVRNRSQFQRRAAI